MTSFPPGLVGEVAQYIMDQAPRPVPEIALAGAVGFLAGIAGRSYNVSGTGLNQYILLLAGTGTGKDAIASGTSKLLVAIQRSVPAAMDFRGPGELVSAPGLMKWLVTKPSIFCVLGEFGKSLKAMSEPRASASLVGLQKIILQLYSKSGHGETLDSIAYSDAMKNTPITHSPSLTIIGETVPEAFYESLDERLIADGLLPRFMVFEYLGKRVERNKLSSTAKPPDELIRKLAALVSHCLDLAHKGVVCEVLMDEEAEESFDGLDGMATALINGNRSTVSTELWNRAHLKAIKLAALCAVGRDYLTPKISHADYEWADEIIETQIYNLIQKFTDGEVGQTITSEISQLNHIIRCIKEYTILPFDKVSSYGVMPEMHRDCVVPEIYLSKRSIGLPSFKLDRRGGTGAMKAAIKMLTDSNDLQQVPGHQLRQLYGRFPLSYAITNPARFEDKKN